MSTATIRFVWILGRLSMSGRFMYWLLGRPLEVTIFQELVFIRLLRLHYRSPIMQLDMGEHIEDKPILVWRNPPDDSSNALQYVQPYREGGVSVQNV
jgi:hypothetical protein